MGKPAQYEGTIIDGYQQQQCGPRSALEIWRSPSSGSAPLAGEATCHTDDFAFVPSENIEEGWSHVRGLEEKQSLALQILAAKGVYWKHPVLDMAAILTLHHGGDVAADGNCLFTASRKALQLEESPLELRLRMVRRFVRDCESGHYNRQSLNDAIRHLYYPDLSAGWGVHIVQEVKLLAKEEERESMDCAIQELVDVGMTREQAAESIYKERCIPVDDAETWAKYMSIAGTGNDEYNIITLMYTEDNVILSVDENREGRAAAFGDDIAIECLANEFEREIYVLQTHGSDAMADEKNVLFHLFFLPHRPREVSTMRHHPMFLFMKGTGWCGSGGDHYEPIIARVALSHMRDKAGLVL